MVEGNLAGVDTTIIVQFFGAPLSGGPAIPVVQAKEVAPVPSPTPAAVVSEPISAPPVAKVSPFTSTRNISLLVTGILILLLSIDLIVVRRKRIARIGGRTLAHIAFLGMILAVILILKAGEII